MKWSYEARIQRTTELIPKHPAAAELLEFYRDLASLQQPIFERLRARGETDLHALEPYFGPLTQLLARRGPEGMAAKACLNTELLEAAWADDLKDPYARFAVRVLLQPYAESLASRGDIQPQPESRVCPFCSAWPVAGVLRGEGEGAKRWLLCSLCGTEWPFRRVLCPGCGEEDKDKLPIYKAAGFHAVRVDACDSCHTYLKSVDLTVDGHAVPLVDEIATVALNIWAEEHGYSKLETNLLGM